MLLCQQLPKFPIRPLPQALHLLENRLLHSHLPVQDVLDVLLVAYLPQGLKIHIRYTRRVRKLERHNHTYRVVLAKSPQISNPNSSFRVPSLDSHKWDQHTPRNRLERGEKYALSTATWRHR